MSATTSPPPAVRKRKRPLWLALVLLVPLGLVGWWIYGQIQTYRLFEAAKVDLLADRAQQARDKLLRCVKTWPASGEVRFLAARAARKSGELGEAMRLLDDAAARNWVSESIDLERALLRATVGEYKAVEFFLLSCVVKEHPDEVEILEVVAPICARRFEMDRASMLADRWTKLRPESARAWQLQGVIWEKRRFREKAIASYREVVRLDPTRDDAKLALARLLLEVNKAPEAEPLLEDLSKREPGDPDLCVTLARCKHALNKPKEASVLLDFALEARPDHAEGLHLRGKLELEAGRPEAARRYLRQAVKVQPFEREVLYTLLRGLQQGGSAAEIATVEARLKAVEADLNRLAELTRSMGGKPAEAAMRCECGEINLRNGQVTEGLRWLSLALVIDPDHGPSHLALARYYESQGNLQQAGMHRRAAERAARMTPSEKKSSEK